MGTQKNRRDETVLLSKHEKRGRTGNVTTTNAEDGRFPVNHLTSSERDDDVPR